MPASHPTTPYTGAARGHIESMEEKYKYTRRGYHVLGGRSHGIAQGAGCRRRGRGSGRRHALEVTGVSAGSTPFLHNTDKIFNTEDIQY